MTSSQWITIITMPILSGAIGWFTNWVAIKMLFHPRLPMRFMGMTFQGLIPRRHSDLADQISQSIAKDFLTEAEILGFIREANLKDFLHGYIRQKWDEKIGEILGGLGMIASFLSGSMLNGIRDKVATTFSANADEFAEGLAGTLQGKLNVAEKIRRNILAFDLKKLEDIINEIASTEFRTIEYLGGVIGFVIGLVQALFVVVFF